MPFQQFEILTADGSRFRFETSGYRWQYALLPGTMDREDKTVVEVLRVNEDEYDEIINIFSNVIAAGYVTEETTLAMPREIRGSQCPRCGYVSYDVDIECVSLERDNNAD